MSLFNPLARQRRASGLTPTAAAPTMLETLESRRLYSVSAVALHSLSIPLPAVATQTVSVVTNRNGIAFDDDGLYCGNGKVPIGPIHFQGAAE